jgi:hypothetical protein
VTVRRRKKKTLFLVTIFGIWGPEWKQRYYELLRRIKLNYYFRCTIHNQRRYFVCVYELVKCSYGSWERDCCFERIRDIRNNNKMLVIK